MEKYGGKQSESRAGCSRAGDIVLQLRVCLAQHVADRGYWPRRLHRTRVTCHWQGEIEVQGCAGEIEVQGCAQEVA